jgi:alpha-beta hydrolase superfamily lysophospholipase
MKRDDQVLQGERSRVEASLGVRRVPMYLDTAKAWPFFGWYHHADAAVPRDCVTVLCGPIGYEYTRVHRTVRHLADRLARRGIPALRFDYHGTGDSPGSDLDADRLAAYQANIRAAIQQARDLSGRKRVCLVGIRLGASLAALVAAEIEVDVLVLWNPVATGRAYVRELQAISAAGAEVAASGDGTIEAGGFVMSAQTAAEVKALDLSRHPPRAGRMLIVERDDLGPDPGVARYRDAAGIPSETVKAPGWSGMTADHQFTVVPDDTLALIVDWLSVHAPVCEVPPTSATDFDLEDRLRLRIPVEDRAIAIEEHPCTFGLEHHLVGVASRPEGARGNRARLPAIVLCNAGSVHHVGPNRLYVQLARELSARGYMVLRFDLEGVGDSVLRSPGRENHPYPPNAVRDARAALQYMRWEMGATHFIMAGLCSGSHTTFHTALQFYDEPIDELFLVNPLTFHWTEGMTLATSETFEDMVQYKKSLRDPRRWLKLLRGSVDVGRAVETAWRYVRAKVKAIAESVFELIWPEHGPRLSQDLRHLFDHGRKVTLFVSENDPGRDIVLTQARFTGRAALETGELAFEVIPGGDHTFSRSVPRAELVRRILLRLSRRFRTAP